MRKMSAMAIGLIIIIVAATAIVVVYTRMFSARATTVRIEPESVGQLSVGDTFTVNVTVENCAEVYGVQGDIRYDPEVLDVINTSEGSFARSTGITFIFPANQTTVNTTIPLLARLFFLGTSLRAANGSGVLLTITFRVIADGSSKLQVFPYPGRGVLVGTYLMRQDLSEIIPELHDSSYAGPP